MARQTILNGLNLEQITSLTDGGAAGGGPRRLQVRAHAEWQGGGRCLITPSPPGDNARAEEVSFSVAADSLASPVTGGGLPNADELLLAALTSDLIAGFVRRASQRGIRIEAMEITTDADVEVAHQRAGNSRVSLHLSVNADCDGGELRRLLAETQRTSPIVALFGRAAALSFAITTWRDGGAAVAHNRDRGSRDGNY